MKKTLFALSLLILFPLSAHAETDGSTTVDSSAATAVVQSGSVDSQNSDSTISAAESSSTTESSTAVVNNEVSDVQQAQDQTINQIEKETGVKKSNDPIENEQDPNKIREMLKDDSMKNILSASEVDGYTDQQLLNAMTLCQRIGTDTYGLDVSGYARILQALYKDNTLSWDKIQPMLNYNPANYTNALEMTDQIDSLQAYLAALYPSNSSFMAIRQMSNQELTNVLNYISPIQEQMLGTEGRFFPGIIAWIARYAEKDEIRNGVTGTTSTSLDSSSTGTEASTTSSTTQSAENKTPAASNTKKTDQKSGFLPKTGEQRRTWLTVAGVLILALIAFILIRRNRKK